MNVWLCYRVIIWGYFLQYYFPLYYLNVYVFFGLFFTVLFYRVLFRHGAESNICCSSEARAAKSHEVKSTFLPCNIRYFSPDFSWKGHIRTRAIARAKLTINQLSHNCIWNDDAI